MVLSQDSELREPGCNERRCIVRDDLGFYRGLLVAGAYYIEAGLPLEALLGAIASTIKEHPVLTTTIQNADTERPRFGRTNAIKLENHVSILHDYQTYERQSNPQSCSPALLTRLSEYAHNLKFENVQKDPPWRIIVAILFEEEDAIYRCVISFVYSHSIGDGTSGVAFHRTMLKHFNVPAGSHPHARIQDLIHASTAPLPPAIDSTKPLPISWSFLFSALTNEWPIRNWLSKLTSGQAIQPQEAIWTGGPHSYDANHFETAVEVLRIEPEVLQAVLAACRCHQTKLTGVLHQLIGSAVSLQLRTIGVKCTRLASSTTINLRNLLHLSPDDIGVLASNITMQHQVDGDYHVGDEPFWQASHETTTRISQAASTLDDQPVGLLRYLSSMRSWMTQKLGKARDTSYELSNAMAFDPIPSRKAQDPVRLVAVLFSQPGDVTGPAITFNVVSLKDGPLVTSMSWQIGALGLVDRYQDHHEIAKVERAFIAGIGGIIRDDMVKLSRKPS